ncbi:MAG: DUF485 domain-containing protein [Spirochaetia bacterium]|jgi:uncharacterized membrane protein (DUF485 family)|nr:DUF485 domain-containing protein [Spirochaetia bacterium]
MLHEPAAQSEKDYASDYKRKLGIKMFIVYGILYAGFVAINALIPGKMETRMLFGLNLAVFYGFSLILIAIISGLFYNHFCTKEENRQRLIEERENK